MTFVRRGMPPELKPHECPLPRWRWLPLLVWPRWREGARWHCAGGIAPGCGKLYEWVTKRGGFYDNRPAGKWVPVAEEKCYE